MSETDTSAHVRDPALGKATGQADADARGRLHNQFIAALSELDRLGEHVAAAYVAAAIDALVDRHIAGERQGGIVGEFAARMAARLGPRAAEVARAQLTLAEGETLLVWTAIVNQIERGDG